MHKRCTIQDAEIVYKVLEKVWCFVTRIVIERNTFYFVNGSM